MVRKLEMLIFLRDWEKGIVWECFKCLEQALFPLFSTMQLKDHNKIYKIFNYTLSSGYYNWKDNKPSKYIIEGIPSWMLPFGPYRDTKRMMRQMIVILQITLIASLVVFIRWNYRDSSCYIWGAPMWMDEGKSGTSIKYSNMDLNLTVFGPPFNHWIIHRGSYLMDPQEGTNSSLDILLVRVSHLEMCRTAFSQCLCGQEA